MWGTRLSPRISPNTVRFTPTHVGNTRLHAVCQSRHTVHPHACGEHNCAALSCGAGTVHPHACGEHHVVAPGQRRIHGSPPRMWGTLNFDRIEPRLKRFTPTHVGNTPEKRGFGTILSVHPHACGEHNQPDCTIIPSHGSPPRMWGTPDTWLAEVPRERFTPTHVGNTTTLLVFEPCPTVHPHACGEHSDRNR